MRFLRHRPGARPSLLAASTSKSLPRPGVKGRCAGIFVSVLLVSGCAAFPTQREQLASLTNDHTFLQQERDRLCNPVAFKGCDAARLTIDRMAEHIRNASKISKDGHITMQLRAIRRDKRAAVKAMRAMGANP